MQRPWSATHKSPSKEPVPRPAPGDLEIVQAFLNTAGSREHADALANPRDLSRWLSFRSFLPVGTELSEEDRQRVVAVRHGLRVLVWSHTRGKINDEAVVDLEQALGPTRYQVRFDRDGSIRFHPVSEGLDGVLEALLEIVVAARVEGAWVRLRICDRGGCGRVFYDPSRNRSGRWCTERCGSRLRTQAFRGSPRYRR